MRVGRRWDGGAWVADVPRRWDGSTWVPVLPGESPYDSVTKRALTTIPDLLAWAGGSSSKVIVEETGWWNNADIAAWNAVGGVFLSALDRAGLDRMMFGPRLDSTDYPLAPYLPAATGGPLSVIRPQAAVYEAHTTAGPWTGTTIQGAESGLPGINDRLPPVLSTGAIFSAANPGVVGQDYWWPASADFSFLAGRGVTRVRIACLWERLQPTLGGALNSAEVARAKTAIAAANAVGIKVILTPFNNYGRTEGDADGGGSTTHITLDSRTGPVTSALFADFWSKMTTAFAGTAGLAAFGLCNEPFVMPEGHISGSELGTGGDFTAGVGGWTGQRCSLSVVTQPVRSGTQALQLTADGSGQVVVASPHLTVPASGKVTGSVAFRCAAGNSQPTGLGMVSCVDWYDAGGSWIDASYGYFNFVHFRGWTRSSVSAQAPDRAATASLRIYSTGTPVAGDLLYFDEANLYPASDVQTAARVWELISTQAVAAIRAVSTTMPIWVNGYGGAYPSELATLHPGGPWINDPQVRYTSHPYFDHVTDPATGADAVSSVGEYVGTYAQENAAAKARGY